MQFGLPEVVQNVPIRIDFRGRQITGVADPVSTSIEDGIPRSLILYLHGRYMGLLQFSQEGWTLDRPADPELVETLGNYIYAWYE